MVTTRVVYGEAEVICFHLGRGFLDALRSVDFGCAVVDISLPDMSGFEVLEALQQAKSDLLPVVLTGSSEIPVAVQAMKLGAANYLGKPPTPGELRQAVSAALAESKRVHLRSKVRKAAEAKLALLSERQLAVLQLSVQGLPVKTVARRLHLGVRTVERARGDALQVLGVKTILEAAEFVQRAEAGEQAIAA